MCVDPHLNVAGEGSLREQLAAYFLAAPPPHAQTPSQRQEYRERLCRLGELERREILAAAGRMRPLVWGNPAPLMQAVLSAAQRLAAGMGQPLLLFPAREAAIGSDTLLHPRLLTVALCDLLRSACTAAPRHPVWVRLQEQRSGLAVAVTATAPFAQGDTLAIIKECTGLHGGSLVHDDLTLVFSCRGGRQAPEDVRLYGCPTEQELLQDSLSPLWSLFYAPLYSSLASSSANSKSSTSAETSSSSSLGSTTSGGRQDRL